MQEGRAAPPPSPASPEVVLPTTGKGVIVEGEGGPEFFSPGATLALDQPLPPPAPLFHSAKYGTQAPRHGLLSFWVNLQRSSHPTAAQKNTLPTNRGGSSSNPLLSHKLSGGPLETELSYRSQSKKGA